MLPIISPPHGFDDLALGALTTFLFINGITTSLVAEGVTRCFCARWPEPGQAPGNGVVKAPGFVVRRHRRRETSLAHLALAEKEAPCVRVRPVHHELNAPCG